MGVQELVDQVDSSVDQVAAPKKSRNYYIGSTHIGVPRPNMEIASLTKDGMSM